MERYSKIKRFKALCANFVLHKKIEPFPITEDVKERRIKSVRKSLLMSNVTLRSWSIKNGYPYQHVHQILHRYAERPHLPRSLFIYNVLVTLEKDTGIDLMDTEKQGAK